MKHTSLLLFSVLGLVAQTFAQTKAEDYPLVAAQELHARAGLPNFFAKASKPGADLKIGYLGGSITAQPGWRVKSLAFLKQQYPQAKLSEINAAIGGTGSDLGVFRVQQDVLDQKPGLMFVEFATNDGGASPEQITRCMEGIVRQTWRTLPECDICFVYTITEALSGPMLEGKFARSASVMESVADHYGIPTIHFGLEVAKLAKTGKLLWKAKLPKTEDEKKSVGDKFVFAPDGVHPHVETGHELYLQAIERSWPGIHDASKAVVAHALIAPLRTDNYEQAKLVSLGEASLSAGFTKLDPAKDEMAKRFSRLKSLYTASKPGETIRFKFKGTRASLYDLVGPDCGQVIVTIDNEKPRIVPRFDAYCTYHRLSTLTIGSDLKDELHTVTIEIHPDQPDKATILAKNGNKIDKPERFDGTAIYPGAILLVGQIVE